MPPGCHSGLAGLFTNNGVQARPRPLVASAAGEELGWPRLGSLGSVRSPPLTGGSVWWGVAPRIGHTQGARPPARPPGAATGGGGGCGSRGRGLRPSNSRLLAPRAPSGRGGRTWRRGDGRRGCAVTAEGRRGPRACGAVWICRGLAWVCLRSPLAHESVSPLHRDVGVCHPEGCLRSRERHGPRTPGGQLSGARRGLGPRQSAPLPAWPPGALRCVLRPLRARPARRPCRPSPAAGRLPLRPHRPACRHRRPGGPPLAWGSPQPTPRPTPGRFSAVSVTGPAAPRVARAQRPGGPGGRPHPGSPGSARGGGRVGPGDRGPAAADGRRPQRAVRAAETRRPASTPSLALEGHVQSLHGTPSLTQGSRSPRNGAQLGAYTRSRDVGDLRGRTPSAF